jgi:hypothetical protein
MRNNTTANYNVATGFQALSRNTTGIDNVAVGVNSLFNNIGGLENVAIGRNAAFNNISGSRVTALGFGALAANLNSGNIGIGYLAGVSITGGYQNVVVGTQANSTTTTGYRNTIIGTLSNVTSAALFNGTTLGYAAVVNANGKVRIGNTGVTSIEGQVGFAAVSDGRFKDNIQESTTNAFDFIMNLRPVEYNFNTQRFDDFLLQNTEAKLKEEMISGRDYTKEFSKKQTGFIAQEMENAMKKSKYQFSGLNIPETNEGNYSIVYGLLTVPLVKTVQEQQVMIEEQNEKLKAQQNEIDLLRQELREIRSMIQNK